jgi:thiol-disulfide isomerase/thioredoxin
MNYLRFLAFLVAWISGQSYSSAQGLEVNLRSNNYKQDTIVIGCFYGDKQLVKDTLIDSNQKNWVWKVDTMPDPGVYFALLKPNNTYFQIFVNGKDQKMTYDFDAIDFENVKVNGSTDNKAFANYIQYLKAKRVIADTTNARIARAKAAGTPTTDLDKVMSDLDTEVKAEQVKITKDHPNTITGLLINSNIEPVIPEFTGTTDEINIAKYKYYRLHYFDNVDLKHPGLIRTPFLHQKVDFYINKLTSQDPDSLNVGIDRILGLLEVNSDAYDYYLSYFLNTYGQLKMVGHDAVVVHLADKYYLKGKAKWSKPENIEKLRTTVEDFRPTLIGKTMPNFTTYKQDGSPVTLYNLKTQHTILVIWDPDCGNCKKTMPYIVDFQKKHIDKDVKIMTICSKSGEKANTCWPFIAEKKMENLINTGDEYQRWNQVVRNTKTPKIFIMDANKKILMKDMAGEDLDKIYLEILEVEKKQKEKGKS